MLLLGLLLLLAADGSHRTYALTQAAAGTGIRRQDPLRVATALETDEQPAPAYVAPFDRPPLGWQNWNGFQMKFNSSLLLNTAKALKANGLFEKGYKLIQYGGASYPHQGLAPLWNSTNPSNIKFVIVRNSTGHYQVDPGKFRGPGSTGQCLDDEQFIACMVNNSRPGATDQWNGQPELCGCANGNGAVAALSEELHRMGFGFGSYSGESSCQVEACNIPSLNDSKFRGFVDQDFDLMIKEWRSDYIMVDSVGEMPPYAAGKQDTRYWDWPRTMLEYWREKIDKANLSWPVILHSCHNGCATTFNGPTLTAAQCNERDPRQRWKMWTNNSVSKRDRTKARSYFHHLFSSFWMARR